MQLQVLPQSLVICRLQPDAPIPGGLLDQTLFSITRTATELSIVCDSGLPLPDDALVEPGWRGLMIEGPLEFSMIGVLAELSGLLSRARISLFVISTHDTDLILVREHALQGSIKALEEGGHQVVWTDPD
jgi:hypothetical protein